MFEINPVNNRIQDLTERSEFLGGIFDYDAKKERLEEVNASWNSRMSGTNPNAHRRWVKAFLPRSRCRHPRPNETGAGSVSGLLELAVEADDEETFNEALLNSTPWKKNWRSLSSAVCLWRI